MKDGTIQLSKFRKFASDLGVRGYVAMGILEALWCFTRANAKTGAIGKFSNTEIAKNIEYEGDADKLVWSLVENEWVDTHPEHRLVIHDWEDHMPNYLKGQLKRTKTLVAGGREEKAAKATISLGQNSSGFASGVLSQIRLLEKHVDGLESILDNDEQLVTREMYELICVQNMKLCESVVDLSAGFDSALGSDMVGTMLKMLSEQKAKLPEKGAQYPVPKSEELAAQEPFIEVAVAHEPESVETATSHQFRVGDEILIIESDSRSRSYGVVSFERSAAMLCVWEYARRMLGFVNTDRLRVVKTREPEDKWVHLTDIKTNQERDGPAS